MAKKPAAKRAAETIEAFADDTSAYAGSGAWTDTARDQYETALKTFNDNAEKFRTQTEEAIASARDGFDAASERMRGVSADAMTAVQEEISDAVAFTNDLSRARTLTDAMEIQRNYWTKLFETRVERVKAMTEVSTEAAREAFEPMTRFTSAFAFTPSLEKFFPFAAK